MNHLPSPVPYREDINGLRAWAVIAVLLFHFQLPGLGAGFMGVDIFFVISGFLMTAIIVKGLEGNNFSIWKFYMARARRILPALMVVITVLLVLGWFFLPTPDYQTLGAQSAYSLSFLSNIHFWRSTGYFDAAAHEKWLLHTWSLAVEAQFYLLFPIFLIILWKIKPQVKTLFWGLGLVFIASLALSIVASQLKPVAAFYLLPTRGWELAAGGLAFLMGREVVSLQKYRKPLLWSGFGLWALAMLLLDSGYAWPSGWALLPVVGTVLIILAHQTQAKLTVNPIAQWLGDRSYSLYLWHWPLVVALYFAGLQNDWLWVSGAIVLSLIFAHLSYHLVEVPTRSYLSAASLRKEVFAIALAGLVIGLAAVSVKLFTFENRPGVINGPSKEVEYQFMGPLWPYTKNDICLNEYPYKNQNKLGWWFCMKSSEKPPTIILLGNSYANQLYPGFVKNPRLNHHTILSIGTNNFGSSGGGEANEQAEFIDEIVRNTPSLEYVIIDGLSRNPSSDYIDRVIERISFLKNQGLNVVVFTPHITTDFEPRHCFSTPLKPKPRECRVALSERNKILEDVEPMIKAIKESHPNILVFEQNDVFCDRDDGICSFVRDGLPLHRDVYGHTSEYASILLQDYFTRWAETELPSILNNWHQNELRE